MRSALRRSDGELTIDSSGQPGVRACATRERPEGLEQFCFVRLDELLIRKPPPRPPAGRSVGTLVLRRKSIERCVERAAELCVARQQTRGQVSRYGVKLLMICGQRRLSRRLGSAILEMTKTVKNTI